MAEKDFPNISAAKLLKDFKTVETDEDRTDIGDLSIETPLSPGGSSLPTWKDWDWRVRRELKRFSWELVSCKFI